MIHRNICPLCGSENPEGSEYCHVCKANLSTLPDDMFPDIDDNNTKNTVPAAGEDEGLTENDGMDLDSPIPSWLQERFQNKDKRDKTNFDFDSFSDALFGVPDEQKSASPTKVLKPKSRKSKKQTKVYQPQLENLLDPPLLEPEEGAEKAAPEDLPSLNDFKTLRPVKKWDDPKQDKILDSVREQSDKAFEADIPLLWQQDMALVEAEDLPKTAEDDEDDPYFNSVSPEKLTDRKTDREPAQDKGNTAEPTPEAPLVETTDTGDFQPESGTLLSDLMNEINRNSVTPTPQEQQENENGTVFYSGNSPADEKDESDPALIEITPPAEENSGNVAFLDQILRGIGYQVEGEPVAAAPSSESEESSPVPETEGDASRSDEPRSESVTADTADTEQESEAEKSPDAALVEDDAEEKVSTIPEKIDDFDEQDIPWDLFGSQDMALPQSPEDPAYRTFSRSSIPAESGSTSYQQRMMSSVLGKIIQAESFIAPQKRPETRKVSMAARLFWSLLALGGIVLILLTGISDRLKAPSAPAAAGSAAFYEYAGGITGNALVVVDYTPAYSEELDAAAEALLKNLEEKADKVFLCVLNPAAMPKAQKLLDSHAGKLEFSGWWPAGAVSIRSRLASDNVPDEIWLLTSESGSVRSWAEQLAVAKETRRLHVLASGQLEPILDPYLDAGLVTSALSRDRDLLDYGAEIHKPDRQLYAVWYLAALLPLAWAGGLIARFLRSDPDYGRNKLKKKEEAQHINEKEGDNDGKL